MSVSLVIHHMVLPLDEMPALDSIPAIACRSLVWSTLNHVLVIEMIKQFLEIELGDPKNQDTGSMLGGASIAFSFVAQYLKIQHVVCANGNADTLSDTGAR